MGIIEYMRYTVACNGCGDELDDLFDDELDAELAALDAGWIKEDDDFYCVDHAPESETDGAPTN